MEVTQGKRWESSKLQTKKASSPRPQLELIFTEAPPAAPKEEREQTRLARRANLGPPRFGKVLSRRLWNS